MIALVTGKPHPYLVLPLNLMRLIRRVRFTMKSLLLCVAVVSLLFALVLPWIHERAQMKTVTEFGGQVFTEPRGQHLLRQILGDAVTERAIYVHLNDSRVDDDWLANVQDLKHVEMISIASPNVTDHGLQHLKSMQNLTRLNFVGTKVTSDGVQMLRESLPKLALVDIDDK